MKKNLKRKLITSICTASFFLATAITSTYAWFVTNTEAWVNNIGLDVTSGSGIYLSIDGVNWQSELSEEDLAKAIVAKYGTTDKVRYYFQNSNLWKSDISGSNPEPVSDDEIRTLFNKIKLSPVTSTDGVSFIDGYTENVPSEVKASGGKYVQFDLYFTSTYAGNDENYAVDVYFNTKQGIKTETGADVPVTEITSGEKSSAALGKETYSKNEYRLLSGLTTFDKTGNGIELPKGYEGLKLKTSDAVRFSTVTKEDENDVVKIYEPNLGLGSYATKLISEDYKDLGDAYYLKASSLDSTKNAGFTYTNNMRGKSNKLTALDYEDVPETFTSFNSYESGHVCTVKGPNASVKVTFTIWIEGWDADCFDAMIGDSLDVTLSFTSNDPSTANPRTITYKDGDTETTYTYFSGQTPSLILPKNKEGKVFKGWYFGDVLYDFTSYSQFESGTTSVLEAKYE